ncbi:MAG: tail fiber domain-containing protein [Bacteroidia bacterium]|nr:tail fiber domain-containing protein [Bacteroidia bacterium]
MGKSRNYLFLVLLGFLFLWEPFKIQAQSVPQGINYQGLARDISGNVMITQSINVKVGIYSPSINGSLVYEETHLTTTNQFGLFYFLIGQGNSTGAGTYNSISLIEWGAGSHFVKISMDPNGANSFIDMDTVQLWSVPYSMHAAIADSISQPLRMSQLLDVDTVGVFSGAVLKWNGAIWQPSVDNNSDTALFALNAGHAVTSDTATYALNVLSGIDTVYFAHNSDSSGFSLSANTSVQSNNSNYCDTALFALNSADASTYWGINGNSGTTPVSNFLGTIDNQDLVVKTNNTERLRITSGGRIGVGISSPTASLHIIGNDGLIAEGTFGAGALPPTGVGTRMMWHPRKAAFRAGGVNGTQWNDANIGNYSFAAGYNTRASGAYSTSLGVGAVASGANALAACENSQASGVSSVAIGLAAIASGPYSVALGRAPQATDSFAVAIGYHSIASANYAMAFGDETVANGVHSITFGYRANSNSKIGCFNFSDASSTISTLNTADNQFMVRASGGVIFYSNSAMTGGVSLSAGGGSWASVSDKTKKDNFKKVSGDEILERLRKVEITTWNYKSQNDKIRHIGPMAQDFYREFGFGESDTTITTIDMDGISLAALQSLASKAQRLQEQEKEIEYLKAKIGKLEKEKVLLEKRILGMEQKLMFINSPLTASKKE